MHSSNNIGLNQSYKSGASRFSLTGGQSTVEFAMVGIVFFLMIFAIMDYGWIMFAQMNIQQAVDDAGRYASTGQSTQVAPGARMQSIIGVIQTEMKVPLSSWNLSICSVPPGSTTSSCYTSNNNSPTQNSASNGSAGGPGSTVTISLSANLAMLVPLNFVGPLFGHNAGMKVFPSGYSFTSSATFRNESFNPSATD
jgi:Flp pilus assembly protein TadG